MWHGSSDSSPAPSARKIPAIPRLLFLPSAQAQLQGARRWRSPPCWAALAARLVYGAPRQWKVPPLRHPPNSAHKAWDAATKIKIPRWACAPRPSALVRAKVFQIQDALCTYRGPPSRPPARDLSFSLNLSRAAQAGG